MKQGGNTYPGVALPKFDFVYLCLVLIGVALLLILDMKISHAMPGVVRVLLQQGCY
jgi:hypothetical protein